MTSPTAPEPTGEPDRTDAVRPDEAQPAARRRQAPSATSVAAGRERRLGNGIGGASGGVSGLTVYEGARSTEVASTSGAPWAQKDTEFA